MTQVLHAPESARFYKAGGGVVLEAFTKTGKPTKPTIRQARVEGWLPSYSNIKGMIAAPGLEAYKIEAGIRAGMNNPRDGLESEESYIRRIYDVSKEHSLVAAERGTEIHAGLQEFFTKDIAPDDEITGMACLSIAGWFHAKGYSPLRSEVSFASRELGYAGTVDIFCEKNPMVADFKTRSSKQLGAVYFHEGMQLACYRRGLGLPEDTPLFTVAISRESGEVKILQWGVDTKYQPAEMLEAFDHTFKLWMIEKKYDPRNGPMV